MFNFNSRGFAGRRMGRGMGRGMGNGAGLGAGQGAGNGMGGGGGNRFRDGSCLGSPQGPGTGRGMARLYDAPDRSQNRPGGFFRRFLVDGCDAGSQPNSGFDWIKTAIDDLQRQIDQLKNTSGK